MVLKVKEKTKNTKEKKSSSKPRILSSLLRFSAALLQSAGVSAALLHSLSLLLALISYYFLALYSTGFMALALVSISLYSILDSIGEELALLNQDKKKERRPIEERYIAFLKQRLAPSIMPFFLSLGLFNQYGSTMLLILGFSATILLSPFPDMMASQVLLQRLFKEEKGIDDPHITKGLTLTLKRSSLREAFSLRSFILLSLLLDLIFLYLPFSIWGLSFRLLLLLWITPLYVIYRIIEAKKWMGYFEAL